MCKFFPLVSHEQFVVEKKFGFYQLIFRGFDFDMQGHCLSVPVISGGRHYFQQGDRFGRFAGFTRT